MGKILLTCVLALVFGFGGAAGAMTVFQSSFQGAQGQTGLTGATGARGPAGADGVDGADGTDGKQGARGKPGQPGQAAADVAVPKDLGLGDCSGRTVQVVTGATLSKTQRLELQTKNICIVTPPSPTASPTAR